MRPLLLSAATALLLPFCSWGAQPRAAAEGPHAMEQGGMARMADAMTRMAEMCETMMKKEMSARPLKMAAAIIFGLLLIVDLMLLAVLEVLWIRHWKDRLRVERQT